MNDPPNKEKDYCQISTNIAEFRVQRADVSHGTHSLCVCLNYRLTGERNRKLRIKQTSKRATERLPAEMKRAQGVVTEAVPADSAQEIAW